ncbi:MAG: zinc ribbon domain-containing protein [Chloroflexi bacterium]|nr:zinc ribbon domain-containing protein [Chloroflexota bacterium]
MPIYEFRCKDCGQESTFFTRSVSAALEPVCRGCGSRELERLVSPVAYHLTLRQVHERYGPPPQHASLDHYEDPRNIGREVEEKFRQWDVAMPQKVRDAIDAAREGTMPEGVDL